MNIQNQLSAILEAARFAPSVHNTQPWVVSSHDNSIRVAIDPQHELHDGDPTGRETIISLGIFCEAIILSAKQFKLTASAVHLENKQAVISFDSDPSAPDISHDIELLQRRCTDRSLFKPATIDEQLIAKLHALPDSESVIVHTLTNRQQLNTIALLTSKGIRLALSNPGFRRELGNYLTVPWSRSKRGISTQSLAIPWPVAVIQPIMIKLGWQSAAEAKLEKRRWESASAVVIITADGDMEQYWFDVGRVYLRVSLAIEDAGMSQATSAAIVEASNYHDDVEEMLGTNQRILAMIRIGQSGKKRRYSPRVDTAELLTSN